jgi:hypothetical protein
VEDIWVVMEEGEYTSLVDIYEDLKTVSDVPKPKEYFLQFLWRDLTSNFDVIGPHYSSDTTMDSVFCLNIGKYNHVDM